MVLTLSSMSSFSRMFHLAPRSRWGVVHSRELSCLSVDGKLIVEADFPTAVLGAELGAERVEDIPNGGLAKRIVD